MSLLRTRSGVLVAVAGLALGGCAASPPPSPEPVQIPHYQMAADHCERLEPDEVATVAGLVVPDGYDDLDRRRRDEDRDYASCQMVFETPDDRFDDVPIGRFLASSAAIARVFAEPGVAEDRYRQVRTNWERLADTNPTFTTEPARGWWDEGLILRKVDEVVLDPGYREDLDVSFVSFARGVRHHNLLLEVTLSADVPTDDLDEIDQLFTDLTQEIADRAMEALELTTVTVTPSPPA